MPLIEDTAKVVKEDSIKAIQYLKEELEKLEKSVPVSRNKDGYDIISNAGDRLTEYKKRCEVKGLIGIPTGIPKLDEITNGWLWGEDLVVLTGRTNVGKTWIGEYFATYNRFESDFGVLNMVLNRHVKADALLAVDLEQVQIAELRPTFYEDLPKGGDYEKGHIINESTIKLLNSYAGAKIINISK